MEQNLRYLLYPLQLFRQGEPLESQEGRGVLEVEMGDLCKEKLEWLYLTSEMCLGGWSALGGGASQAGLRVKVI